MTEPLDVDISTALLTRFTTPALTSPATPIAKPFIPYTPTPGTAYLDARAIMRAAPEHPSIDFGGSDILRGIFQIDAVVPDTHGENPGLRLASLVAARFPLGLTLAAGAQTIRFHTVPAIAAAIKDAPWVRFPVTIPYILFHG